ADGLRHPEYAPGRPLWQHQLDGARRLRGRAQAFWWPGRGGLDRGELLEDAADDRPAEAEVRAARRFHLVARVPRRLAERARAGGPAARHWTVAGRHSLGAI